METQEIIFNRPETKAFADLLKENGFDVIITIWGDNKPRSYFYFHKGGKIGYFEDGGMHGFIFNSVHKPSREVGTGYRIKETFEPTIKDAEDAFCNAPSWGTISDAKHIRKHKDLNEFLSTEGRKDRCIIY